MRRRIRSHHELSGRGGRRRLLQLLLLQCRVDGHVAEDAAVVAAAARRVMRMRMRLWLLLLLHGRGIAVHDVAGVVVVVCRVAASDVDRSWRGWHAGGRRRHSRHHHHVRRGGAVVAAAAAAATAATRAATRIAVRAAASVGGGGSCWRHRCCCCWCDWRWGHVCIRGV